MGAIERAHVAPLTLIRGPRTEEHDGAAVLRAVIGEALEQEDTMHDKMYPLPKQEFSQRRRELTPEIDKAFHAFSDAAFAEGALSRKVKQLVSVAVAHTTQCPYCIRSHTQAAMREGASEREIMEAIWVASEMRAGAAFAHSNIALEAMSDAAHR